ncbi:MAG: HAD-IA family hydrolase [Bacteroidota bacterium]|nr:HAD-IA family hydrolase [Bacteroidota bacterium]
MQKIVVPEHIKGLIFDCDGTLVDSMPMHMKAWEYAITHFGAPWNHDFIFSQKGVPSTDIVELYNQEFLVSLDTNRVSDMKQEYFKRFYNETKVIQPVVDIVFRYNGILPMSVASGGSRENVHAQLDVVGLTKYFPIILTASDDIKPKPAPDLFLEAARLMNVPPHLCQVFEDGDLGLEAAEKAGMLATDVRGYEG